MMLQRAITSFNNGKTDEAERLFREVLKTNPSNINANHYLAILLLTLGRLNEAEISFKKALELKPDSDIYQNLANTQIQLKKFEEAEINYKKVLEFNPDNLNIQFNLGNTLKDLNKLEEAELSYKKAIELKPDYAEAHNALGNTLKDMYRYEDAEVSYKKAIELKPYKVSTHNSLGNTLVSMNKLDEAEICFKKIIKLKPDYAEAYNGLGNVYINLGQFKEAETYFKKTINLKPDHISAYRMLATLKNFNSEDHLFIKIQNLYHNKDLDDKDRCELSFALGKIYEDLDQFDKSFKYYNEGNNLKKKLLNYKSHQDNEVFNQLKKSYVTIKKNSLVCTNEISEPKIIFVLGMPRSGTTLVEQIISSHSEVEGAGELKYATSFGDNIARGISTINSEILENFKKNYLKEVQELSNGASMVIDKAPLNFKYIGLICSTIPGAKIISVERNAEATCWGCYKKYFAKKTLSFTYNLDDLINFYKLYKNIMKFWEEEFGSQIYNLNYENLTMNQEDETKKLIQFLGLKWEKECLSPQNNKRNVSTASVIQVRQKIYQNSSQKWKKFKPYLKGIFDDLNNIL